MCVCARARVSFCCCLFVCFGGGGVCSFIVGFVCPFSSRSSPSIHCMTANGMFSDCPGPSRSETRLCGHPRPCFHGLHPNRWGIEPESSLADPAWNAMQ